MSLTLLAGCGDSGSGDAADGADPSASAGAQTSTAAAAVKPLTAAELGKAALAKADVAAYEVKEATKAEVAAADAVEVTGAGCEPLGRAVAGAAVGEPDAKVSRRVTGNGADALSAEEEAVDINVGMVALASYAGSDEAGAALKSVSDAVAACAGGFQWTAAGELLKASKVEEEKAPAAGDEAVAFSAVTPVDGVSAPWKVVVFRKGATLAHFVVSNTGSMVSGKDFTFPADLVTAQADKLT
ncbi:hypothetical protein [Streptomyces sp. cg40]|uniref:hypothetical protein n=1 Tax=Streptomyces sp. cg40 TaxID=3419764 RepID=UPI003D00C6CC